MTPTAERLAAIARRHSRPHWCAGPRGETIFDTEARCDAAVLLAMLSPENVAAALKWEEAYETLRACALIAGERDPGGIVVKLASVVASIDKRLAALTADAGVQE